MRRTKEQIEPLPRFRSLSLSLFSPSLLLPLPSTPKIASSGALLVVLLETHLGAWRALTKSGDDDEGKGATQNFNSINANLISPPALIAAVAAFVGAYELEAEGNGAVVLAVHAGDW